MKRRNFLQSVVAAVTLPVVSPEKANAGDVQNVIVTKHDSWPIGPDEKVVHQKMDILHVFLTTENQKTGKRVVYQFDNPNTSLDSVRQRLWYQISPLEQEKKYLQRDLRDQKPSWCYYDHTKGRINDIDREVAQLKKEVAEIIG